MIDAIVFDIGNVLCEWNPQKLVQTVFSSPSEQQQALEGIIHHQDWLDLDRGTLTLQTAINRATKRTGITAAKITALFEATPPSLVPFAGIESLIQSLRHQGMPLYVLSNMHGYAFSYLRSRYTFWNYFHGMVISSHIKKIKPEPAIYRHLLDQYKLRPTRTLFLDDMAVNVAAAQSLNIKARQVTDPTRLEDILRTALEAL